MWPPRSRREARRPPRAIRARARFSRFAGYGCRAAAAGPMASLARAVGRIPAPGDLRALCDRIWCVESLDLDSLAVAETLSL